MGTIDPSPRFQKSRDYLARLGRAPAKFVFLGFARNDNAFASRGKERLKLRQNSSRQIPRAGLSLESQIMPCAFHRQ
jgi:hypothetical protein